MTWPRRLKTVVLLSPLAIFTPQLSAQESTDPLADAEPEPSPLVRQPSTPSERLEAALLLSKLTRIDLARQQIAALLDEEVTDASLLDLRSEYGMATFLELAGVRELQPEAGQLLQRMVALAGSQRAAPDYIDDLLKSYDGSLSARRDVVRELRSLGPGVVPPLLDRAAQSPEMELKVERILTAVGGDAADPLAAAVVSGRDVPSEAMAVRVLARNARPFDIPELAAVASDPTNAATDRAVAQKGLDALNATAASFDAARTLRQAAIERLRGEVLIPTKPNGSPLFFGYSEDGKLVEQNLDDAAARRAHAVRLLEAAIRIDPNDAKTIPYAMAMRLSGPNADEAMNGLLATGPSAARATLRASLDIGAEAAAVRCLRVMSHIGSTSRLSAGPEGSPVVRALDNPSSAIAFAAAEAIVELAPKRPIMNGHRVVEILVRPLESDTVPTAVVIDPNSRRGADFGGRLSGLGLRPILADSGRKGFEEAARRGDVDLIAVNASVSSWELNRTLANLKLDPRTAEAATVVYSDKGVAAPVDADTRHDDISYLPAMAGPERLSAVAAQLDGQIDESLRPDRRRAAQLLRSLAERGGEAFNVLPAVDALRASVSDASSDVAVDAAAALSHIAGPGVQQSLLTAVQTEQRADVKLAAADALVDNLRRFGPALSADQIGSLRTIQADNDPALARALAAAKGLTR